MFVLRHQSLSGERRSCGALWGRDWTFTSTGSQSRCRKKARQEPRPPDLRGVWHLAIIAQVESPAPIPAANARRLIETSDPLRSHLPLLGKFLFSFCESS